MLEQTLNGIKPIILVFILGILYFLEIAFPFYHDRKGKLWHDLKNVALGFMNAVIISVLFTSFILFVANSSFTQNYGLLNLFSVPFLIEVVIMILLFDLWMYLWHVMNHKIPFFWRFHKVHHSDKQVDASSALRFHTGEIVLSTIVRLLIITILGLSVWHVILYEIVLLPIILFHHSNINFPERWDKIYRMLFASPHMHWIHHSDKQIETDSNYGSIFSFWDRIFKTFRLRNNHKTYLKINQGLTQYQHKKWESFIGMLKMPFSKK